MSVSLPVDDDVIYPESDGKPMADNDAQRVLIETWDAGFEALYADRPDVYVSADLLCYPVEGNPRISVAPDVLIVFGRPKGKRGSWRHWVEDGHRPQAVFEILSPSNDAREMMRKRETYTAYGVEEYVVFDPGSGQLEISVRADLGLVTLLHPRGWHSDLLGVAYDIEQEDDGSWFLLVTPDGGRTFERPVDAILRADEVVQDLYKAGLLKQTTAAKLGPKTIKVLESATPAGRL